MDSSLIFAIVLVLVVVSALVIWGARKSGTGKYDDEDDNPPVMGAQQYPEYKTVPIDVVDMKYQSQDDIDRALALDKGDKLRLERVPKNEFDPDAIAAYAGNFRIGYLSKDSTAIMSDMLGEVSFVEVVEHIHKIDEDEDIKCMAYFQLGL